MAALIPRRFSKPETLRNIDPKHLIEFLGKYKDYFSSRDVLLPESMDDEIDYSGISAVLLNPDSTTHYDLTEALYYINEATTPDCFNEILAEAKKAGIDQDILPNVTSADLALQVWLKDRTIIEKVHAEQKIYKIRSFQYFRTTVDPVPEFKKPSESVIKKLESGLDAWLDRKMRGKHTHVNIYPKRKQTWFTVRHGKPYTRESVIKEGKSSSQHFRPEKFDVIVYNHRKGEIRINAESKGEVKLYRTEFGLHLFGDEDFFSERSQFEIEVIRRDGEDVLVCSDVEGLDWVRLKMIEIYYGSAFNDVEVKKSDDLFASVAESGYGLPKGGSLTKASFLIKFSDNKTPRTITLTSGNRAQFKRDDDAEIIESWLTKRGFIVDDSAEDE